MSLSDDSMFRAVELRQAERACFLLLRTLYRNAIFSQAYRELVQSYIGKVIALEEIFFNWDWDEAIVEEIKRAEQAEARL